MQLLQYYWHYATSFREDTPWSNKEELYIKLMKEAVHKDMKEANCPLCFWDYCLERRVCIYKLISCDHIKVRGSNPYMETFSKQGIFPTYASSVGTTGVIFEITSPPFPMTKKCLVLSLAQLEGKGMNYRSG